MVGQSIGHYKILEKLGAGGMGEVYRAEDTTLDREVALKVLPGELAESQELMDRFQREAKTLAALDHPNIVTIFSVESSVVSQQSSASREGETENWKLTTDDREGGRVIRFLTMQLVEGETLAEKIAAGPIPLDQALAMFRQIAEALRAAHQKGIIHRDLKPANIKVTLEEQVKLLDFGLAKASVSVSPDTDLSQSPTLQMEGTAVGMLIGTAPYMSPEQARGQPADERTDIWAFGCCLFESLSGHSTFLGDTASDTIAKILERDPDWWRLPADTPESIRQLLRRCLRKNLSERLRTITDLDLEISETPTATGAARRKAQSVAALPFLNLSPDPENEFFADGMTEDVIAQLSKIGDLKVISRTSVMPFKQRQKSLREMAAILGVETLLDGSVRRVGNRVRIVAQLIEADTEQHLWAETYDRDLDDIFEIQSDVALQIASALETELSPGVKTRIERQPTSILEAYHLYLEGRHCVYRYTDEGIRRGLELYERALKLDPDYALVHAHKGLAYVLVGMGYCSVELRPAEAYAKAKEAATRAVDFDSDLADAHAVLGLVKMTFEFDWPGAEAAMTRALELNPGYSENHAVWGLFLSSVERHDEAIEAMKRARDLDPLAAVHTADLATKLLRAGYYEMAAQEARHGLGLEPRFPLAHSTLGWAYLKQGRTEVGLAALAEAVKVAPGNTMFLAQLGQAYAEAGRLDEAQAVEEQLGQVGEESYVSPYHMAYLHTGLADYDRAIDCLEQAYEESASGLYGVKGSFLFAPLHGHPRFQALLKRMNFPED